MELEEEYKLKIMKRADGTLTYNGKPINPRKLGSLIIEKGEIVARDIDDLDCTKEVLTKIAFFGTYPKLEILSDLFTVKQLYEFVENGGVDSWRTRQALKR